MRASHGADGFKQPSVYELCVLCMCGFKLENQINGECLKQTTTTTMAAAAALEWTLAIALTIATVLIAYISLLLLLLLCYFHMSKQFHECRTTDRELNINAHASVTPCSTNDGRSDARHSPNWSLYYYFPISLVQTASHHIERIPFLFLSGVFFFSLSHSVFVKCHVNFTITRQKIRMDGTVDGSQRVCGS